MQSVIHQDPDRSMNARYSGKELAKTAIGAHTDTADCPLDRDPVGGDKRLTDSGCSD
jgi:hypothetical protein